MRRAAMPAFASLAVMLAAAPASAQTEAVARRECLQAIRQQGVRGYALDNPRFARVGDAGSLTGGLVLGASRLEFSCTIDRRGKVTDLVLTTPPAR